MKWTFPFIFLGGFTYSKDDQRMNAQQLVLDGSNITPECPAVANDRILQGCGHEASFLGAKGMGSAQRWIPQPM